MGREEDGLGFAEALDELADLVLLVRVEAVGRLVEDQHFGIVQQGLGEAGAVAVAFRQGIDRLVGHALQEAGRDGAFHGVVAGVAGEPADLGAEAEEAADRHVVVERGGLGQVADLAFRRGGVADDGDAADLGIAGGRRQEAGDHPHGGGFAGAVGAEEAEHFAFPDGKREVIDGGLLSELFRQVLDFDHGITGFFLRVTKWTHREATPGATCV